MIYIAAFTIGLIFCFIAYKIVAPLPKLSKGLSPYDTVVKLRLGIAVNTTKKESSFFLVEFFHPIYEALTRSINKIIALENNEESSLRLEQAGLDTTSELYRKQTVKSIAVHISIGFLFGVTLGNIVAIFFFPLVGGFIALSKSRAKIDKLIESRAKTMRLEMYTINQLLALYIRTGSGVSQSLTEITRRTHGIVSDEIRIIMSRVNSGMSIDESLLLGANSSPEAQFSRTCKLLAASSKRGVDLTTALMDLSHDLRRKIREETKATGAKRRAAMLIPTIGILAPIMLLFVAAPIPSIVLGGR